MKRSPSFRHQSRNNSNDRSSDDRNSFKGKLVQPKVEDSKKAIGDVKLKTECNDNIISKEKKFSGRCQLFVGNIPNEMTDADFKKMFEKYGVCKDAYLCANRGFGFIRMETRHIAEKARAQLDGIELRGGRFLRVRMACHSAAIKVKYLSPYISNEILEQTFSMFGEVERAVVIVDDKGKPVGEGIVEFTRKQAAYNALNKISEGIFFMTSQPRPIEVERYEPNDESDGLPEMFALKTPELTSEREKGARFAQPGSLEAEMGMKWKKLYHLYREQEDLLKKNFAEEVAKLEADQANLVIEQRKHMIMQDVQRRQEELRMLEKTIDDNKRRMEMMRQEDGRKRPHLFDDDMRRAPPMKKDDMMMHGRQPPKNNPEQPYMNRGMDRGLFGMNMQAPPVPPNLDRVRMGGLAFLGNNNANNTLLSNPLNNNMHSMQPPNIRMRPPSRPIINNNNNNNNNNGGLLLEPNMRPAQQGGVHNAPPFGVGNSSNHHGNSSSGPLGNSNNNGLPGNMMRPNMPLLNTYNNELIKRPRRY